MRHGSLFSGIGGFDLAAQWMGWENVFQVERDPWCQKVLKKNFTQTKRYGDIDQFSGIPYYGAIDILSGGPPCQPSSNAGKRKGEKDDRWKWPEAIRVFGEIRPLIGVFENPDDILSLDNGEPFERICSALEDFGYQVETYGIPAACVGAWHRRDRVWIIAYADRLRLNKKRNCQTSKQGWNIVERRHLQYSEISTYINSQGFQRAACAQFRGFHETSFAPQGCELGGRDAASGKYWQTEPGVVRMVHGLSGRVDRIKGLGNAIVPQIAFEIFKAIGTVIDSENNSTLSGK